MTNSNQDPVTSLSRTILSHTDISASLLRRSPVIADSFIFNNTLPYTTHPITNQRSSGRCWLFSSTNVLRYTISQHPKLNLATDAKFQLSQSYLFFYDKLEKANYYLENSIELADKELDDRLVQYLSTGPLSDGGQWDMVVNLLEKYGVVPQPVYPESFSSSNSGRMNSLLTTKLREHALRLRKLDQALRISEWHVKMVNEDQIEGANVARIGILRKKKEEFMREIYNMMTICLGVPPSHKAAFKWEYYDKNDKACSWTGTPVEFYKAFAENGKNKPTEAFSLINDPRNEYEKLYTVDRLGNVWGGKSVRYVNTNTETLKQAVIKCIRAGHPVFFGCDVGKFSNSALGIMDADLYGYEKAFGITLGL
jgi:bleomycin hydrolase